MALLPRTRFVVTASAILLSSALSVMPAHATSPNYRYDWDYEWLQQTNGGFSDDYFYDPTTFYYTLPSRAKSFALHSYHRQNYYKTFHSFPAPPDYQRELTPQQLVECGNYTFSRYDRVPPFGYECRD
ncbi:MAG: hypothetical protein PHX87_06445 [Candidatus Peribacteraceae bacterium]|nr:hypothetical protein [Candidatus Peribacteraceae bacterium]MDD5743028.1 hypothetical protein [Candidatus Peribacteraceae bacterium]